VQKPFRRSEHVLAYLGRYPHRIGFANCEVVEALEIAACVGSAERVEHADGEEVGTARDPCGRAARAKARALPDVMPAEPRRATKPLPSDANWEDLLREVTGRDLGRRPACGGRLESVPVARAPPAEGEAAA
jgi:hypothetical protein